MTGKAKRGGPCKACMQAEFDIEQLEIRITAAGATCEWRYDPVCDKWDTQCGNAWQFSNDASISENGVNFCPYCGGFIGAKAKG